MRWRVEYNNDTGLDDESFDEWWEVTDGTTIFKANQQEHAHWLCARLNENKRLMEAVASARNALQLVADKPSSFNFERIHDALKLLQF